MGLAQSLSQVALGMSLFFALMLAMAFPYLTPGTGPYIVAILAALPVTLMFVTSVVIIYIEWDPI